MGSAVLIQEIEIVLTQSSWLGRHQGLDVLAHKVMPRSDRTWEIADDHLAVFVAFMQSIAPDKHVEGLALECDVMCYWEDREERGFSFSSSDDGFADFKWTRNRLAKCLRESIVENANERDFILAHEIGE